MRNAITTFSIFEKVNLDLKSLELRAARSEASLVVLRDAKLIPLGTIWASALRYEQ